MSLQPFTPVPATRAVGSPNPPQDMDNTSLQLLAMGSSYNVMNAAYAGGADPTGTADSTAAFNAAMAAGGPVFVPPGTYLFNSSSAVAFTASGQWLRGAGEGATILQAGASFSAAELISCTGLNDCGISDLSIESASGAWSAAPAANGVAVAHSQRFRMRDVRGFALNGYLASIVSDATGDSYYPVLDHVTASFCKAGAALTGTNSSDHLMAAFLSNCTFEECEDGDGLLLQDVIDVTTVNLECSPAASPSGGGTPGISLHIKGDCASHFHANVDLGGLVSGAPCANPAVLIEASGGNSPFGINISNGIAEFGTPGVSLTAGSDITLAQVQVSGNADYGLEASGAAGALNVLGCLFDANNYAGGAGAYDLYWNSSGKLLCQDCLFTTPSGSGAGEVAAAASVASGTGTTTFQQNRFNGATAFNSGGGFPSLARNNAGYNPTGFFGAPSVPASGTPYQNFEGVDAFVTITAAAGGTCAVAVGSGHTIATIPASGFLTMLIPYSLPVTLTYSTGDAPAWVWYGL